MSYKQIKTLTTRRLRRIPDLIIATLLCSTLLAGSLFNPGLASAACANTPDSSQGTDTQTVSVPSTGTYYVWSRLLAPDTTNNSYYLQIDGGCAINVGDSSSIPANTWTWVNYQDGNTSSITSVNLTAGNHQIVMTGREAGVGIDRVLFLGDQGCTPTGTGDNCTPVVDNPPTISITAPTSGATVSGKTVALSANASDDNAVSSVSFAIDGTSAGSDSSFPYTVNWDSTAATDGSHTLVATATDSAGHTTSAQETFTVANHTCAGPPSAPSISGTSGSPTQTSLNWTTSMPQSGCSIQNYTVYRGSTLIGTVAAGTTTLSDSGLAPNTIYTYHVTANDNGGHSTSSANASVTTQADTTAPSAPGSVKATAPSPTEVDLSWTVSTDNIAVAGYRVYRTPAYSDGSSYKTVNGAGTDAYVDGTVAANTAYHYQVGAIDTSNNVSTLSSASPDPITTPQVKVATPPSAPGNLHTTLITANTVVLAWNASTDSAGNPVAGYRVFRNGTQIGSETSSTTYTDTPLNASTAYSYSVTAYDSNGNPSVSNPTINATTLAAGPVPLPVAQGNLNGVGAVDYLDAAILYAHWNQTGDTVSQGNLNGTGKVDYLDAAILYAHWGQG